eukprot:52082-Chlamydomonas_euryale.AAC.9
MGLASGMRLSSGGAEVQFRTARMHTEAAKLISAAGVHLLSLTSLVLTALIGPRPLSLATPSDERFGVPVAPAGMWPISTPSTTNHNIMYTNPIWPNFPLPISESQNHWASHPHYDASCASSMQPAPYSILLLGRRPEHAHNHGMVALVRLQSDLLLGLELQLLQLLHLAREDRLGRGGRVNAARLDGDDKVAAVLQEVLCIEADNTGLVWLGDVGKDDVNHGDEHAVLLRVARVLDDRDDVGALLGHVDKVTARPACTGHVYDI